VGNVTDPWRPLWRTGGGPHRPALEGTQDAEVAIVGAGLEGLSLAGELARRGMRVAVIEATEIGSGATGASAGIVSPQLVRQSPQDVARRLGQQQAALFLSLLGTAGKRTFERVAGRIQQTQAINQGFISPAKSAAGLGRIRATVDQWRTFRTDLQVLCADETRQLTGAVGYAGALLDPTGGSLNPVAYAQLLASDAEEAGALICLHSKCTAVERSGSQWKLSTAGGTLLARQVVLCANGTNATLASALRRSVLPLAVCQMATQPLTPEMRRSILPAGHSMTDIEADVFSIRFDIEGRLITAYPMSERLREPGRLNELVNRRLATMLPAFRPTPLEYAWSGTAWLNSDLLPRVVSIDTGLFGIQACNGRGIALSTVIGEAFGTWLAQGGSGACPIPIQRPRAVPGYVFARYVPSLLMKLTLTGRRLKRAFSPRPRTEGQ
jgi:glycine/D-amino acid oxidase-like deaminating enzyme